MSSPLSRARSSGPPDPVIQGLKDARLGLLRLHKALVDSERARFEAGSGALSNGQFLQALIGDPFFAWLRPFSGLIVEIDEALHGDEPMTEPRARAFLGQVLALVSPPAGAPEAELLEAARRRDPAVHLAHGEAMRRIAAAGPGPG